MLNAGIFIPSGLSVKELEIMKSKLKDFMKKSNLHISFYRTSDIEILKFLLEIEEENLKKITIHIFSNIRLMDEEIEKTIKFLESRGMSYKEYLLPETIKGESDKNFYNVFLREMLRGCDEALSFKSKDHRQISKIYRPLDLAKEQYKDVFEVDLTNDGEIKKL